jgi:outer membrane protein assembly factor BamD
VSTLHSTGRSFCRFLGCLGLQVVLGLRFVVLVVAASLAIGCASSSRGVVPAGTPEPDKFLFERGTQALSAKKWVQARDYFKQVVETYTQSPYRPDAKIGIGDTYFGEGQTDSLVLAISEYREFLNFYPTNSRADYAQFRMGMSHFRQMRDPQRDQTETRDAIKEFNVLIDRYPMSTLLPEVNDRLREARDRLYESDYRVGYFYFRQRWYPGAVDRFLKLLQEDPTYSGRDAVYFYLAESLVKLKREAQALPYYERVAEDFTQSPYLENARKRIDELKAPAQPKTSASGG